MNEVLSKAAADVLAERERQKTVEGWTRGHDDQHMWGEMARAASCYAIEPELRTSGWLHKVWPWDFSWWKPTTRRRDLVKAGALIIAEIERLDRAALSKAKGPTT